jgi:glycosyltransferase involved in cell wall biosynthesis
MRLLMTADTVGGVWDFAMMLCSALAAQYDVSTVLVSMGPAPSTEQLAATREIPGLTLIPTTYALEWMPDSLPDLQAAAGLVARLVAEHRPHVVHFNQHYFGCLDLPVPSVVVSHSDSLSWQYYQWGAVDTHSGWIAYRDLVRAGLRGASAVVAPTAFVATALRGLYVPRLPVRVIHNGADLICGVPARPVDAARPIDAMGAGRVWDTAKNLLLLAEAAALLAEQGTGVQDPGKGPRAWDREAAHRSGPPSPRAGYRVEVAGSLSAPHGSRIEVERMQGVRFLDHISRREFHTRLTQTRVFVAPARYEPFGLSLVEAALAGCALLASGIPSFQEVWGDAAIYVAGTDAPGLARALAALLDDEEERRCRAAAARARALHCYSTAAMAAAYMDLYRELRT